MLALRQQLSRGAVLDHPHPPLATTYMQDLCKRVAPPTATTPRVPPMGRKGSGSRPGRSAGSGDRNSCGSRQGRNGDATLPVLQQHPILGKLPSLRKALSQPLLHAELPHVPARMAGSGRGAALALQAAPELAAPAAVDEVGSGLPPTPAELGMEHGVLGPIPEQGSSDAEAARLAESPSQPESRHLGLPAATSSSGIAQSATTLFNKILGRKPATAAASAAVAAEAPRMRRAAAAPAATVERSASSPASASSAAELPARTFCKHRLSPPLMNITARAASSGYGQPASPRSPRQLPSQLSSSTSGGLDGERWVVDDRIPAFYSKSTSFTSAVSSLPRLTSGTGTGAGTSSPHRVSSLKGSFSPPVSRTPCGPEGSLSAMGSAGPGGAAKPHSSQRTSMPGEASSTRALGTVGVGGTKQAEAFADAGAAAGVQHSVASWSHPAMASGPSDGGSGKMPAHRPRKLSATEIRLSMHRIALGPGAGADSTGGGGGGGLYKAPAASCVAAKR